MYAFDGTQLSMLMNEALARAIKDQGSLTVCVLDVDHFKLINNRLGHQGADRLIDALALRLAQYVGGDSVVVRAGGDEFVLLTHDAADDAALQMMLSVISEPFSLEGERVSITASLGVSRYPDDHAEADGLLRHARQAMYRAKQNGRNTVSRFDPGQDRLVQQRQVKRRRFARAIENGELILHYQPQIDMATAEVIGFEALVRWKHPKEGLKAPDSFLPLTEGTQLETSLGEWVLRQALTQLGCWQQQGLVLPVSVNISPSHLLNPDFVPRLEGLLAANPWITTDRLKLEVVETAAMHDIKAALDTIDRCQAMGIEVAIDDFGTGFSSLTYLRQLPVDMIKIDKSFVRDMLTDPSDLAIVESVIYMARRFDRALLAEGVETLEHADALLGRGCRLAQGYGIARPMAPEAVVEWLQRWRERTDWQGLARQSRFMGEREAPSGACSR
ncbi:putative bifunctional diguanylate cyclase/phosphodiesterase [Halomonas chromatireducens]|uniref:Phytochrome-like protein cph2 n=1 Tax=Halomonas chromatireducens TaxID=507626 RepID=A0A120JWX6_9GAMM|nr:bifunctional diguanylate cyclase/phosphodiesterase [Halomonas chromatireducens]AMD02694.1 Phytochrome-like protein cph2 [Halomonas chromatireducens]